MITGIHLKRLKHKAARILATVNNLKHSNKQNMKIIYKHVLDEKALLVYTEDFAGTRIVIGEDGSYLLGSEHLLLDRTSTYKEQQYAISIKELIQGYSEGVRTEYTNLGFVNLFPNWWDIIFLGINNEENHIIWQHGKPYSPSNLFLTFDEEEPNILNNIIDQLDKTKIWEYKIIRKNTSLEEIKNAIEKYKYEILNRFMKQDFVENKENLQKIDKYVPKMLIFEEIFPLFDKNRYKTPQSEELYKNTILSLSQLASQTNNSGINILFYTNKITDITLPQNIEAHFITKEELKNIFI